MSDNETSLPSIADSLENASNQVSEIEQGDAPNPISVDNVDPEKIEEAEKKKTEPEKRREAIKRAADKSKKLEAAREKAKEKKAEPVVSGERHVNRHMLRGIIDKHLKADDARIDPKSLNTDETREHRAALRAKYPGANLKEIFEKMENWDASFTRDPVATREAIMQAYSLMPPQNFAKGKPAEYEQGLRGSLQRARENQRDLEELQPYIDKFGKNFPHILRQLVEFDRDMTNDPALTSARLAAAHGAPVTDTQVQQYQAQRQEQHQEQQHQERVEQIRAKPHHERTWEEDCIGVREAVDSIAKRCNDPSWEHFKFIAMPEFYRSEVQEAVAVVLQSEVIPRSGRVEDRMAELKAAYTLVMEVEAAEKAGQQQRRERGSKSVHGAPSHGGGGVGAASASARAAVERAMRA